MRERKEGGQAIVLVAAAMTALLAIVALAIDGGRVYYDRRALQGAADASALAAADAYQTGAADVPGSIGIAADLFAHNVGLSSIPGGAGSDSGSYTGGGYQLQVLHLVSGRSDVFKVTAHHDLGITMLQVVGIGPTVPVGAEAWANTKGGGVETAILALSTDGCPGTTGVAVTLQGGTTVNIVGDVQSNGGMAASSKGSTITVDGSVGYVCPPAPTQVTATQTVAQSDPAYATPDLTHYLGPQPQLGHSVVLAPGVYASDPMLGTSGNSGCYFLATGVYTWPNGYTTNGGELSDQLVAPGKTANPDLIDWSGAQCAGAVYVETPAVAAANQLAPGSWGVEVTSLRSDTYWIGGTVHTVTRESSPSSCTAATVGPLQGLQVGISNVPGAQGYSVYLSPTGCSGPFGLARTMSIGSTVEDNSGSCPVDLTQAVNPWPASLTQAATAQYKNQTCRLGYVISPVLDRTNTSSTPGGPACSLPADPWTTGTLGCPPPSAAGLDIANQGYCVGAAGTRTGCPGQASPGAVEYYLPAGARLNAAAQGTTKIFAGRQFGNIVLYAAGPSGPSGDSIEGGSNTEFIGLIYMPGRDLTVNGGTGNLIDGSLVVSTLKFTGGATINITYNPDYMPPPPGARLIR